MLNAKSGYLAGLRVGTWESLDEIKKIWAVDKEYVPCIQGEEKAEYIKRWHKAISMAKGWENFD